MNITFNKTLLAQNIAMVLAVGVITSGCAGNTAKPMPSSKVEQTIVTAKSETISEGFESNSENQAVITAAKVEEKIELNPTAPITPYPDVDISEISKPEQLNFQFEFDKAELNEKDTSVIKRHAKFLIDNPDMVINVNGHTDHYGPKVYNEYLSKKRADAVAKILIESGVQKSQIKISALADSEPLLDVNNTRLNRRVELDYIEMNMVSAE